jgi:hypothetical protein
VTKIIIVATSFQGCITDVQAFLDPAEASKEMIRLYRELGIRLGHEAESQHSVTKHEVEIH